VGVARDFDSVDPWQESLERSLARRGKSSTKARRQAATLVLVRGGLIVLVVAAIASMAAGGHSTRASAPGRSAAVGPAHTAAGRATYSRAAALAALRRCGPVARSSGYVNPLSRAAVRPERIDQGVDYAGTGTLTAIGPARLTYVGTSGTGWPGSFIEYELLAGPDAGCYVFYAEGVVPEPGLGAGQQIHAGQRLATIIPGYSTGIELGWGVGTGTTTYAAQTTGWSPDDDANNVATAAGKSFSALIASLGGPPGIVEG
jgi:hypothetical protein